MANEQSTSDKGLKTGALLGGISFLLSPVYSKLGVTAALAINAAILFSLDQNGRTVSGKNATSGFFSNRENQPTDLPQISKNIIEGGADFYDYMVTKTFKKGG